MEEGEKRSSAKINEINGYRRRVCIRGCAECIWVFAHWARKQHDFFCGYVTIPGFSTKDTDLERYKNAYRNELYGQITGLVRTQAPKEKYLWFIAYHHYNEGDLLPNNKGPSQFFVASEEDCVKQNFSKQDFVRFGINKRK